jgi:hypothetical protein
MVATASLLLCLAMVAAAHGFLVLWSKLIANKDLVSQYSSLPDWVLLDGTVSVVLRRASQIRRLLVQRMIQEPAQPSCPLNRGITPYLMQGLRDI